MSSRVITYGAFPISETNSYLAQINSGLSLLLEEKLCSTGPSRRLGYVRRCWPQPCRASPRHKARPERLDSAGNSLLLRYQHRWELGWEGGDHPFKQTPDFSWWLSLKARHPFRYLKQTQKERIWDVLLCDTQNISLHVLGLLLVVFWLAGFCVCVCFGFFPCLLLLWHSYKWPFIFWYVALVLFSSCY